MSRFSNNEFCFAKRMLEEAGVAATPGVDFDPQRGQNSLRLCYAGARDEDAESRAAHWRLAEETVISSRGGDERRTV